MGGPSGSGGRRGAAEVGAAVVPDRRRRRGREADGGGDPVDGERRQRGPATNGRSEPAAASETEFDGLLTWTSNAVFVEYHLISGVALDPHHKMIASTSGDSIDDFQVSSSSVTSDNSNLSSLGVIAKDQWKMTFKKVYCPLAARLESTAVIYRKEIGQASPVSVLEPLSEDCSDSENMKREPADPYDLQLRLELVKFPPLETAALASSIGGSSDILSSEMKLSNDEPIELVEDILEEFEDEEERDFSYLLDILIASGIHGTTEDQLYKVCQSLDCPAGYDVFEKLEKKYTKVVQWSISDRKLLFDMVNTILSQILAPCLNMQPWVNTARNLAPLWGSEGLLEKVLQVLTQKREELELCKPKPERKALDKMWPDLADCIDRVGRDIEKMIKDDLLEELLLELLSS
ncbi:hypothetical protein PR202_gb10464 [Eleusine coracana subsp. coracana]|uniref:DUF4378 domain-containing protein n=1 Tax=Eleusine coracana subsp. coracana TaxID=191504 RepID=A0AAV5EJC6_ELECO|nr:hypothetical protein PR202_gb10464 [Eleusine coracana subsp. coracana]